ncbi:cold-shock protein [Candidatus Trichorickettsia mobilis]|uniref:cold-shock protein n=1 Tax=Candidatus Trichorickettsia mobilis TaxID=1346319 RepID=UPI00292F01B5|nr:cold shock domain-containing protein [Candidatus Trichorickettsia mobilis]
MYQGTVKWFDANKGYGFIAPEDGSSDVFIHAEALDKAGIRYLGEGDKISYEIARNKGRTAAANVKVLKTS